MNNLILEEINEIIKKKLLIIDNNINIQQYDFQHYHHYQTFKRLVHINEKYINKKQESDELKLLFDDKDLSQLAKLEYDEIQEQLNKLQDEFNKINIIINDKKDNNCRMEIRAGVGGDEATLFAQELVDAYLKLEKQYKWKMTIVSDSESKLKGTRETIIEIKGNNAYDLLKLEAGNHRVQRVPATESSNRIHTSAITVSVLPINKDINIIINPKDIRIDVCRSSGAGGQHVNTTDSAVRITHIPTGIVVNQQDEKSQHKNKDKAMGILKERIYNYELKKSLDDINKNRNNDVGTGDRSEKCRTYNFPQDRITDHRINLSIYNIISFMKGELFHKFWDALAEKNTQLYTNNINLLK